VPTTARPIFAPVAGIGVTHPFAQINASLSALTGVADDPAGRARNVSGPCSSSLPAHFPTLESFFVRQPGGALHNWRSNTAMSRVTTEFRKALLPGIITLSASTFQSPAGINQVTGPRLAARVLGTGAE